MGARCGDDVGDCGFCGEYGDSICDGQKRAIEDHTVAAIVAWLRSAADRWDARGNPSGAGTAEGIALKIERGEWRKPLTGEQLAAKHGFRPHGKDPKGAGDGSD